MTKNAPSDAKKHLEAGGIA